MEGRTHRRLNGSLIGGADAGQAQSPPDDVGGILQIQGQNRLAGALDAQTPDIVLDKRVQLLQNIELVHLGGKLPDLAVGHGIGEAQLQIGSAIAEHLPGVLIADTGADHADLGVVQLHAVQVRLVGELLQPHQPLLHGLVLVPGQGGDVGVFHDVPLIVLHGNLHPVLQGDDAAAVVYPDGGAQHEGVSNCSDSSKARLVKSLHSWLSAGSSMGILMWGAK